jgi:hypothetical protein
MTLGTKLPETGFKCGRNLQNPQDFVNIGLNSVSPNLLTVAIYVIIIKSAFHTKIRK